MIKRILFTTGVFLFAIFGFMFPSQYEIVIKNGRIVDGSGNPWFYADVGIRDGKIAKIGWIDGVKALWCIVRYGLAD